MLNEVDLQVIEQDASKATTGPWFDSDLNIFGPICQVTGLDTTKCRGRHTGEVWKTVCWTFGQAEAVRWAALLNGHQLTGPLWEYRVTLNPWLWPPAN